MISSAASLLVDPDRVHCFPGCSPPDSLCLAASPSSLSPPASRLLSFLSFPICSLLLFLFSSPFLSASVSFFFFCCPGRSSPGPLRPRTLQSGCVASPDVPVRGTGCTPGRSSPGVWAVLQSTPDAPIRDVLLSYCLRCLGCSSPWHRVHPRTIQSGGLGPAPLRPGCSNPGRLFVVYSPLPRMLQSVAPGTPRDDPVRGLVLCSVPPRMLQSGASFYRILSVAWDAPIRGTGFQPGRCSLGAWPQLQSALDALVRGVIVSYSLSCLWRLRVWCIGCFLFARPFSLLLPCSPRSPLLSLPPFSLPLRPCHPRSRFSLPLVPFPPFVVVLLGHAIKLLVKRYPEPMAHGPEACEPSHPCRNR